MHVRSDLGKEEAVSAADFEHIRRGEIRQQCFQGFDALAKVEAERRLFGDIVEIFFAVEIVLAVQRRELGIANPQIRGDETAIRAAKQSG